MILDGQQRKKLQIALIDAFPNQASRTKSKDKKKSVVAVNDELLKIAIK